ncbi:MAG: spondin domain-containing protein [Pseudomonadales bacterium]|nr:spondin domain-containing protein [Pseudomonadales bacterium]
MTNSKLFSRSGWRLIGMGLISLGLVACGSDSDTESTYEYEVTITNLTAAQPFSPVAVVLHKENWQAFELGESVSEGVEMIAESGDNSLFLQDVASNEDAYSGVSGAGIVGPGGSETISVEAQASGTISLSLVSMLVNTNDALTALQTVNVSSLDVGDAMSYRLRTYDAGTEANSESADTIPGPAAVGGLREGFNSERDDVRDEAYVHAGVVTQDDGLATSTLTQAHRWDNPAAAVTIRRIQ